MGVVDGEAERVRNPGERRAHGGLARSFGQAGEIDGGRVGARRHDHGGRERRERWRILFAGKYASGEGRSV